MLPSLLILETELAYRQHFERNYCRKKIMTHDGIQVYFRKEDFDHAFFESPKRDGIKSKTLSCMRSQRMNWIAATLANPDAVLFQGWDKKNKCYKLTRRVSIVFENFIVVISISTRRDGTLKANFKTCYQADNSIEKIRQSPLWDKQKYLDSL